MLFSWLKNRRRRHLLSQAFPEPWSGYLQQNLAIYSALSPAEQQKLRQDVQVFVAEKHWVGCGGLEITDEIKVTIASQACLMLLGIDGYCFDGVKSILVYPAAYAHPPERQARHLIVQENLPVSGESWQRGPVVLSWDAVLREGRDARYPSSLVIHEFAHHLDALDGDMGGTPPIPYADAARWEEVLSREYRQLVAKVQQGLPTLLDRYGATNREEFFAVATECFFRRSQEMQQEHTEMYGLLRGFYRLDPVTWDNPRHAA
jgi:Mlc titration factor MtfA (ptsG expression regulator)